jgi:hypothetical protein
MIMGIKVLKIYNPRKRSPQNIRIKIMASATNYVNYFIDCKHKLSDIEYLSLRGLRGLILRYKSVNDPRNGQETRRYFINGI